MRRGRAPVGDRQLPDFQVLVERHKVAGVRLDAAAGGSDHRVAHAVAARIVLQGVARRLPGRGPELSRFVIPQIHIAPAEIHGHIVVPVAGEPAQAGVAIKRIAPGRVGNDSKISLATQVVDPWKGRVRLRNHVLAIRVVEMSELHLVCALKVTCRQYNP